MHITHNNVSNWEDRANTTVNDTEDDGKGSRDANTVGNNDESDTEADDEGEGKNEDDSTVKRMLGKRLLRAKIAEAMCPCLPVLQQSYLHKNPLKTLLRYLPRC